MEHGDAYEKLTRMQRIERAKAIIQEKQQSLSVRPFRRDGYVNVLNRYGTSKDSSEAYEFVQEPVVPDTTLTVQYEDNGIFAKIIDTPADEALKHGFELNLNSKDLDTFVKKSLDALEFEEKAATAIKWARLYGGSIIVMLVDDGRGLEEPLDWDNIRSIDELRVYERAVVQPDYASLYSYDPMNLAKRNRTSKFGMPEFYYVHSLYGSFTVHESRCMVFRNGILPERVTNPVYRFWGTPEYSRIRRAMRDTLTTHGDGPKLLDRSVQPVYKMKDLASILSAEGGDDIVMKRLELIDLARGILNSIAIDKDGEDYDFKSFQFTGIKDVVDASCNMLSAVTNIPQTILFGRSPAGENSTGHSDLENYYNYVEKIQKLMLKKNLSALLDILFQAGLANGEVEEIPDYDLEFKPLWSLSETEQATVDKTKADTELVKAQTAQIYVQMQAMDPSEVREALKKDEAFTIEEVLDGAVDEEWGLEDPGAPISGFPGSNPLIPETMENANQMGLNGYGQASQVNPNMPANMDDENWITMSGTHVLVGEEGTIVGGPPNLKGKQHQPKARKSSGPEKLKSRAASQYTFLSGGKHWTIEEAKASGKDSVLKAVAKGMGIPKSERDEAAKNGELSKLISDYQEKFGDSEVKKMEKNLKQLQNSGDKYSKIVAENAEEDKACATMYGGRALSTKEYYDMIQENAKDLDVDDFALQRSYIAGGYGIKAEILNEKLYSGKELSQTEKDFVDMVQRTSISAPREMDLYRGSGISLLEHAAGTSVSSPTFWDDVYKSVGQEITNPAVTSTAPGVPHYFSRLPVVCRVTIPKGQKICPMQNCQEGEIVLPAGAKTRITKISTSGFSFPTWDNGEKSWAGGSLKSGEEPTDEWTGQVLVEMELVGYGE